MSIFALDSHSELFFLFRPAAMADHVDGEEYDLADTYAVMNVLVADVLKLQADVVKLQQQVRELQTAHQSFASWVNTVWVEQCLQPI